MAPSKTGSPAKITRLRAALEASDWATARPLAAKLLKSAPKDPDVLSLAAHVAISAENNAQRAKKFANQAIAVDPDRQDALSALQIACKALGDRDGAADAVERRIRTAPTAGALYYGLANVSTERAAPYRERIERSAVDARCTAFERAGMFAALGLLHEADGAYADAFSAFGASKKLLNRVYDPAEYEALLGFWRDRVAEGRFADNRLGGLDDRRMVFIVGMARSGSTLTERILSAHPQIAALGERTEFGRALRSLAPKDVQARNALRPVDVVNASVAERVRAAEAYLQSVRPFTENPGAARWVDKLLGNVVHCGAIAMLFPKARIVITERDPKDVFVSCWRTLFNRGNAHTETMERFAHSYAMKNAFSALWREALGDRVLEMPYEAMVSDVEPWAKRLIDHVGLDWDPACARPHEQKSIVQTASAFQVRAPVHTGSIGNWRRYETELAPLLDLLNRDADDRAPHLAA